MTLLCNIFPSQAVILNHMLPFLKTPVVVQVHHSCVCNHHKAFCTCQFVTMEAQRQSLFFLTDNNVVKEHILWFLN